MDADSNNMAAPTEGSVVSTIFADGDAAQAAIAELREMGVPAASISIISRDEGQGAATDLAGTAGVAKEELAEEGLTYRASTELPNDEDLPITEAAMTGGGIPIVLSNEIPPDEPMGGSRRLGLNSESDLVRRNDASSSADLDIYTDFPDQPGGVNPDSPASEAQAATEQIAAETGQQRVNSAAVGAGLGSVAGLLAGIAALAVPGIGPLLAAGPLAAALGGMLAGGAAGGVIGALSTAGIPEEYARQYAASIEQGQTLVSVQTNSLGHDAVERVLVAHGGQDVH